MKDLISQSVTDQERVNRIRLSLSDNIGPATYHQLVEVYGSASEAIEAIPDILSGNSRSGRRIRLFDAGEATDILEKTVATGSKIITFGESDYPRLLAETINPPPVLYVSGDASFLNKPACGIVGSRNCSANGKRFTREVARGLGISGWLVVSGLARGIDTAAHEASLETGTISVIATGLDIQYPPENASLQNSIAEHGCVVTEMPPGTGPRAELFPRRNRIIAGLSAGIIVVEAALRSGSLITARIANEIDRDVFAVPGSPYDARSEGTNKLIRDGANLITNPQDVLSILNSGHLYELVNPVMMENREAFEAVKAPNMSAFKSPDTTERETIAALLGPDPVDMDTLIREAGLPSRVVQMILVEMDLNGELERHSGQRVSRLL